MFCQISNSSLSKYNLYNKFQRRNKLSSILSPSSYNHFFHSKRIYISSRIDLIFLIKKKKLLPISYFTASSRGVKAVKARSPVPYTVHIARLTTRLVTRNKRFHPDRSGWNMNRAVREASGGQRYRSPPPTSHLEPAAYLARWPVIFEGSVTGLAATKSPRVPASRDSLCINDELYRFLSRAADRDGWEPEGRVEKSKNLLTELACNE